MQQRIDTFVNAIYVYEDKIILTFNDKEGTKTISLDEINGSDLDSIAAPSRKASDPGAFFVLRRWPSAEAGWGIFIAFGRELLPRRLLPGSGSPLYPAHRPGGL